MRLLVLLSAALLTGACAATPVANEPRSPRAQQELDRYLSGKVAGAPQACLPRYSANDMVVIDDNTILFRDGGNRVWRTEMLGGCTGLATRNYALVTRQFGSGQLCRGEIAQLYDTVSRFTVSSCSFGDFVPYVGPSRR